MLRFKTEEEFKASGWKQTGRGYFDQPQGSRHHVNIIEEMFDVHEALTQEQIHVILEEGEVETIGYLWTADMFIEDGEPLKVVSLCSCAWNKHPLYCRCPN